MRNQIKVYIIDDVSPILTEGLALQGFDVIYEPDSNRNTVLSKLKELNPEVLVLRSKIKVDKDLFETAKNLRLIARAGAGMDNIDETLAQAHSVKCINAGEANSDAVGDHTLGLLLNSTRNISKSSSEVKRGLWLREANRGIELSQKTVGIIGYGNTGKAVAKRLVGFGCKVLVYDKYLDNYGNEHHIKASMEQIWEEADILSLHIPLNKETDRMVNLDYLLKFKKPILLLNLSRGAIVKTADLIQGLQMGKIIKCALDVLENEDLNGLSPLQKKEFDFLVESDSVTITPHVGGWTIESYDKISEVLLKKILKMNEK
jgi:D-3-phosphoglycerate dehydrogenase